MPVRENPSPIPRARTSSRRGGWSAVLGALAALGLGLASASCTGSDLGNACRSAGGACTVANSCGNRAAASAQDCNSGSPNPGFATCCLDTVADAATFDGGDASAVDANALDAGGEVDASAPTSCVISATSYNQSCSVDTDCVEVTSTDYCSKTSCLCGGSAINAGAMAAFNVDVAKTPLGSGAGGVACPCAATFGPCCRSGQCTDACLSPSDTLPACADAGGSCVPSAHTACGRPGPANGCAYSDQTCCLN